MTWSDWLSLAIVVLCLLLSAFLSSSETGLTAASRAAMRRLQGQGNPRAEIVNDLLAQRGRMLGVLSLGSNVLIVTASSLVAGLLAVRLGQVGILAAIAIMALVVIVFVGVLPKVAALDAPDRTALIAARPAALLVRTLGPVLAAIEALMRRLLHLIGGRARTIHPRRDDRDAELPTDRNGEKHDRDRFGGLLDLRELEVSDVMIHRTKMVTVNADDPPEVVVKAVLASTVTRLPVWREKPGNIVGMLRAKDILRALQAADGDAAKVDIAAIMTEPWFVPDTTQLADQLKAFRRRRTHFALVVDEYGEVMGLVTLNDIMEEIVGDISDERDVDVPGVRPQIDGSVHVEGSVAIRDLNRAMNWSLPDEDVTTIAGLVIHEARSIPEVGQSFTFHGFRFLVVRKSRNRITALRITPLVRRMSGAA
jgi:Mg2+/Co2+ transporter CorB